VGTLWVGSKLNYKILKEQQPLIIINQLVGDEKNVLQVDDEAEADDVCSPPTPQLFPPTQVSTVCVNESWSDSKSDDTDIFGDAVTRGGVVEMSTVANKTSAFDVDGISDKSHKVVDAVSRSGVDDSMSNEEGSTTRSQC